MLSGRLAGRDVVHLLGRLARRDGRIRMRNRCGRRRQIMLIGRLAGRRDVVRLIGRLPDRPARWST